MSDIERALVIGATGNIGRITVDLLRDRGIHVRGLARDATPLTRHTADARRQPHDGGASAEGGVGPDGSARDAGPRSGRLEAVSADLRDLAALEAASEGVDATLLIWPFMTAEGVDEVVARLRGRIVYVSAMSVRDDLPPERNGFWGQVEAAIRRITGDWTFLRPSGFATNTLQWAPAVRAGRPVRIPFVRAARSLIHERDIAEAAVVAMTEPGHAGRTYLLTGPAALTQQDQVRIIGGGAAVEASRAQARAEMLAWSDPAFADAALDYWASLVDSPEPVTDGVLELTGHPARSFAQWAADHAADFRPPSVGEGGAVRPLSTEEVARRYVDAFAAGRMDLALPLYDPDAVRAAPLEGGGEIRGLREILANGERLTADLDIHGVDVDGPYVGVDGFAVRFTFDQTRRSTGQRSTLTKMSLLNVDSGRITREEVYYLTQPG